MTRIWTSDAAQSGTPVPALRPTSAIVRGGEARLFALRPGDAAQHRRRAADRGPRIRAAGKPAGPCRQRVVQAFHVLVLLQDPAPLSRRSWRRKRRIRSIGDTLRRGDARSRCRDAEARADSLCLVAVPGQPMAPDAQDTPTDILVDILPLVEHNGEVPPPLAPEVVTDLRIHAATASAFRVKAGQYIQIIDVDGRQSVDFLAFDAAIWRKARYRPHHHAHPHELQLLRPRPDFQIFRRAHAASGRGGAGYGRPARYVPAGLHGQRL
ncbi:DUF1989 domain-containing protein [Rhizobium sp. 9140]|uniref:DUF1989 domain-containing protein n=1 Tax=Rhizobium sp. 9140 TaxID=1761900 RepID=UPI0032AF2C63